MQYGCTEHTLSNKQDLTTTRYDAKLIIYVLLCLRNGLAIIIYNAFPADIILLIKDNFVKSGMSTPFINRRFYV